MSHPYSPTVGSSARLLHPPDELREGGVLQVPHAPAAPHQLPRYPELCGHSRLQRASQALSQVRP